MARAKNAKTGAKSRGTPRRGQQGFQRVPDYDSPDDFTIGTFSLRDEARNSEHRGKDWSSSGIQLRHQRMNFVRSIGPASDSEATRSASARENEAERPDFCRSRDSHHSDAAGPVEQAIDLDPRNVDHTHADSASHTSYLETPPSPSSTSEDEVIFVGRKNPPLSHTSKLVRPNRDHSPTVEATGISLQVQTQSSGVDVFNPTSDFISLSIQGVDPKPQDHKQQMRQKQSNGERQNRIFDATVEEALDDYANNVRENGEAEGIDVARGTDTEEDGGATSELQDSELMSASEEILRTISKIISKRERPSGIQYLVVWEDQRVDEARWVLHASLPSSASALVVDFEEKEKSEAEYPELEDGSDSESNEIDIKWGTDEELDEDDDMDVDDFEDERDIVQRRKERMTDEHIARLLQKQDSLGINSSDLEIFDGEEDPELPRRSSASKLSRAHRKGSQKRSKARSKPGFGLTHEEVEFMLEGDDYSDFDPMDRESIGIMTGDGNSKNPFTCDLSDSDMINGLQAAWTTDRKKKKAQKKEREELRAQGLLGKKKSKPDLKKHYNEGMGLGQLEKELEEFLFSDQQNLSLPPMDKRDRKTIHDIANKFGLNSKSQGSGKKRFPILHKTRRTVDFDDTLFDKLNMQLNHRFFVRMDGKGKGKGVPNSRRAGGGSRPDIGYREGEIVGASAPEIGVGNRGRAMLEKMGWSTGTALGTLDNQGILKPIEHIVKNSKAGLG